MPNFWACSLRYKNEGKSFTPVVYNLWAACSCGGGGEQRKQLFEAGTRRLWKWLFDCCLCLLYFLQCPIIRFKGTHRYLDRYSPRTIEAQRRGPDHRRLHDILHHSGNLLTGQSSWTPKTQPNDSRAAVWLSFWCSTRPSADTVTN